MISALKIETMEEERLLYSIITPQTPKRVKDQLFQVMEEFEEQRAI
jgi:hypothetical protein